MGGSVSIDSYIRPSSNFNESNINISNSLDTIHILNEDNRIALGRTSMDPNNSLYTRTLSEFEPILKPGGVVEVMRRGFNAPDDRCCLYDERFFWVTDNGSISSSPNINDILITCHPGTSRLGYTQVCDVPLSNVCISSYTGEYEAKCRVWFNGLYKRIDQISLSLSNDVNNYMMSFCRDNMKDNCIMWLESIRAGNNSNYYVVADNFLNSIEDRSQYKCAFSPDFIKELERGYGRKECWYKECSFAPSWKLLTENIVLRNTCAITECNVRIRQLDTENTGNVNVGCDSNDNMVIDSKKVINIIFNDINTVYIPSHTLLFLMFLLFFIVIFVIIK